MLDQGWAFLVVGVSAAVASIIVAIIQQFRRENRDDHAKSWTYLTEYPTR